LLEAVLGKAAEAATAASVKITDSKGWEIVPGAWIRHLKRQGEVLAVEATERHPEGIVSYCDAKTLGLRVASAPTVTVMAPGSKAQDRYECELAIPTSQRTSTRVAREKAARRAKRPKVRRRSGR
jgi:hypothetical protein